MSCYVVIRRITNLRIKAQHRSTYAGPSHLTRMTFKTRPSTYRLELATGRARCRGKCKALVPRGSVRIVTTAFVRPNRATCFTRCGGCIDRAFATAVLAVYTRANRMPVQMGVPTSVASEVCASVERMAGVPGTSAKAPLPQHTADVLQTLLV